MEIEEVIINPNNQYGRKTENYSNNVRLFQDKRMTGKEAGSKSKSNLNDIGQFKGRDLAVENDKQPLLSRNVLSQKIDQNNLNMANGSLANDLYKNKIFIQGNSQPHNSQLGLNRGHYDAMSQLRTGFAQFRDDHQSLIQQ